MSINRQRRKKSIICPNQNLADHYTPMLKANAHGHGSPKRPKLYSTPQKHGYVTAVPYPVSETYPIRIRLGYGWDTYPRRVRVSQVLWAGNLRMETSRPGRYGPAAQSRVPTSRSRLRLTHGQKGRTASAVPRLPLLLAPPSSSPSPFASPRRSRPRSTPPLPRRPSPPRSTRTSRRPALASPFASQIGPPPRPPTRAPPRAADSRSSSRRRPPRGVVALPESPFDSQIGAAKAATLLGRPRSEADEAAPPRRRPASAVLLLLALVVAPPSSSSRKFPASPSRSTSCSNQEGSASPSPIRLHAAAAHEARSRFVPPA